MPGPVKNPLIPSAAATAHNLVEAQARSNPTTKAAQNTSPRPSRFTSGTPSRALIRAVSGHRLQPNLQLQHRFISRFQAEGTNRNSPAVGFTLDQIQRSQISFDHLNSNPRVSRANSNLNDLIQTANRFTGGAHTDLITGHSNRASQALSRAQTILTHAEQYARHHSVSAEMRAHLQEAKARFTEVSSQYHPVPIF